MDTILCRLAELMESGGECRVRLAEPVCGSAAGVLRPRCIIHGEYDCMVGEIECLIHGSWTPRGGETCPMIRIPANLIAEVDCDEWELSTGESQRTTEESTEASDKKSECFTDEEIGVSPGDWIEFTQEVRTPVFLRWRVVEIAIPAGVPVRVDSMEIGKSAALWLAYDEPRDDRDMSLYAWRVVPVTRELLSTIRRVQPQA